MLDERLRHLGNRLLRQPDRLTYAEHAVRSEVLVPERQGVAVRPAAIMLPGHLNRAVAAPAFTSLDVQKAIAVGGPMTHPATVAHTLFDVRIEQTSLYVGGLRKAFTSAGVVDELVHGFGKPLRDIPNGLLTSTPPGLRYFGDWLFENNSRTLLARDLGMPALAMVRTPPYGHAPRYEQMLGLDANKVVRGRVRELVVVDDWGHPPEKAARYYAMRNRIGRAVGSQHKKHGVFMISGLSSQTRYVANEDECVAWALRRDLIVLNPARLRVDELMAELRDARCVIGLEGSNLMHGLMVMALDGFLLGIVAGNRFAVRVKEYADALDVPMALLVAEEADINGIRVNINELDTLYRLAYANT